jgi:acyl-CoA synthetase (AMP-forming)/AMP-acid ligase II
VTSRFFETALLFPNKTALQYDNESVTFHQLSEKVNLLCSQFLNKGIKSGDKILVLHPLSIDLYASLLALLKLNCCLVFVEEWTKLSDIIACQKQINCQYIICSKKVNFIRLFIPSLQRLERISLKHTAQYPITNIEKVKREFPNTDIETILSKGRGAFASSGSRPNQTPDSWAYARLASVLTGGKAMAVDRNLIGATDLNKILRSK